MDVSKILIKCHCVAFCKFVFSSILLHVVFMSLRSLTCRVFFTQFEFSTICAIYFMDMYSVSVVHRIVLPGCYSVLTMVWKFGGSNVNTKDMVSLAQVCYLFLLLVLLFFSSKFISVLQHKHFSETIYKFNSANIIMYFSSKVSMCIFC